jgi:hypothetical protein
VYSFFLSSFFQAMAQVVVGFAVAGVSGYHLYQTYQKGMEHERQKGAEAENERLHNRLSSMMGNRVREHRATEDERAFFHELLDTQLWIDEREEQCVWKK